MRRDILSALTDRGVKPSTRLGRRRLLQLAAASGIVLGSINPAYATPATVTYTVAYTGADFTSYVTATGAIGTDFTASSSGQVLLAGSTSSVINIAVTDGSKALVGHPLTISGVTCLITAQSSNQVTVSARAGYPANFGSAPSVGTSYSIADVTVVISIGQAAAYTPPATYLPPVVWLTPTTSNGNMWVDSSGDWTISGITWDSAHYLTIQGNVAPSSNFPLRQNWTGNTNQPVLIVSTNANGTGYLNYNVSGTGNFLVLNDIQIVAFSKATPNVIHGSSNYNATFSCNNAWLQVIGPAALGRLHDSGSGSFSNSVFAGDQCTDFLISCTNANNLILWGYNTLGTATAGATQATSFGSVLKDCEIFGCAGLTGTGPAPTLTRCFSDLSGTGITTTTAAACVVSPNGQFYSDFRTPSTAPTIGAGGAPALATDIYGVTRSNPDTVGPMYGGITVPALKTPIFLAAYNGDFQLSLSAKNDLGALSYGYDLTYFSSSHTCPSTAADSTHIVLATFESSPVGHPIQWKSGNICMCTAFSGGIATVGALVTSGQGLSANFGGTPQSGDAYTIFPVAPTVNIGPVSSGNTVYSSSYSPDDSTGWIYQSAFTSPTCMPTINGAGTWNQSAAPGTIVNGSQIALVNNGNHTQVFSLSFDNLRITNVQTNSTVNGSGAGGNGTIGLETILGAGVISVANVTFDLCIIRGENWSSGNEHSPIGTSQYLNSAVIGFQVNRSVVVAPSAYFNALCTEASFARCSILSTQNLRGVVTSTTGAGSNITLDINSSNTGPLFVSAVSNGAWYIGHPNITPDGYITGLSTTGGVTTVSTNATATGTVNIGDTIYFGMLQELGKGSAPVLTNLFTQCAIFGFSTHSTLGTYIDCATEYAAGQSGFTTMLYQNQFNAADGVATTGVDARPKAGNGLGIGTPLAGFTTDLYGNAYDPTNPTLGAIQYGVAPPAANHNGLLLMGVG